MVVNGESNFLCKTSENPCTHCALRHFLKSLIAMKSVKPRELFLLIWHVYSPRTLHHNITGSMVQYRLEKSLPNGTRPAVREDPDVLWAHGRLHRLALELRFLRAIPTIHLPLGTLSS